MPLVSQSASAPGVIVLRAVPTRVGAGLYVPAVFVAAVFVAALLACDRPRPTLRQSMTCSQECSAAGYNISRPVEVDLWRDARWRGDPIRCKCRHGSDAPDAATTLFYITSAADRCTERHR